MTMAPRDIQIQLDIAEIIDGTTGLGGSNFLDELTLLRVALRLYLDGHEPDEAVARASQMMSDSLSKIPGA
jgi:hypothetical protein